METDFVLFPITLTAYLNYYISPPNQPRNWFLLPYAGFFKIVWNFLGFFGFFCFFGISFKVTNVTTKSYQGYYWTPKIAKNGPKQHNKLFFARRAKKASDEGRNPPQELEIGPRSGPYVLVCYIMNMLSNISTWKVSMVVERRGWKYIMRLQ